MARQAAQRMKRMSSSGEINFHHALKPIPTRAREGNTSPVGVINPIMPIPNRYAFTISRPGTCTKTAKAPMMGIVSTAMPEEELMNKVKIIYKTSIITINNTGGMVLARLAA